MNEREVDRKIGEGVARLVSLSIADFAERGEVQRVSWLYRLVDAIDLGLVALYLDEDGLPVLVRTDPFSDLNVAPDSPAGGAP